MRNLKFYHEIEEEFEEMLNDCYPEVEICGYSYESGRALKLIDETAFNCGCSDWSSEQYSEVWFADMTEEEIEHYGAFNSTVMYCHVDEVDEVDEVDDVDETNEE
jgi:hypothetical protein